VMLYTRFYS